MRFDIRPHPTSSEIVLLEITKKEEEEKEINLILRSLSY
jgi:hypothetical protein